LEPSAEAVIVFLGISENLSFRIDYDIVIQHVSSVILTETTELIGAEHILSSRVIKNIVNAHIFRYKAFARSGKEILDFIVVVRNV
jgi:altronate dehydratase